MKILIYRKMNLILSFYNSISWTNQKYEINDLIAAHEKLKSIECSKFIIKKSTSDKHQCLMCYIILTANLLLDFRWLILGLTDNEMIEFILADYFKTFSGRVLLNWLCLIAGSIFIAFNIYAIFLMNFVDKPFVGLVEDYVESIRNSKKIFPLTDYHEILLRAFYINGVKVFSIFTLAFICFFVITHFLVVITTFVDLIELIINSFFVFLFYYLIHYCAFSTFWLALQFVTIVSFCYCQLSSFIVQFKVQSTFTSARKKLIYDLQKFNNWIDTFNIQISFMIFFLYSFVTLFFVLIIYFASQRDLESIWLVILFRGTASCIFFIMTFVNFICSIIYNKVCIAIPHPIICIIYCLWITS